MPPQQSARREKCLSAKRKFFAPQRSEDMQGRKMSRVPAKCEEKDIRRQK
jgi:hypothetical protein